jgi:hypothetical protein
MKISSLNLSLVILLITISIALPRSFRVNQIPNGEVNSCQTCHINPEGGGVRNAFGKLIESRFLVGENVNWNPLLASLDADNDGVTNGEELQDMLGSWSSGSPAPGNSARVTLPGSFSSNQLSNITINFSEMTPHAGQRLFLRVIDKYNFMEVGRTEIPSITANFNVQLKVILPGHSYYIDFFADHNNNGLYNAPPTDHAWRLELNNAVGNDQLNFIHNTSFVDIKWPYLLTLEFTGMTPHVGQLFEIKVEDNLTGMEVGRKRLEAITQANFNISVVGIELAKEYKVEFYADHNNNGIYNSPPSDHAWELKFENTSGNINLSFAHNTDFKDINWKYLYTLNLSNMTPHLNQPFGLRVVRIDNSEEIGRVILPAIQAASFSVSVPAVETGHNYDVDFFADHNSSGLYEAPPADHAWRLTFISSTGNFVQNFTHNTSFTDIQWPNPTDVSENNNSINPNNYELVQNYPNPFNPTTKIKFFLQKEGMVTLKVYNLLGGEVGVILNENLPMGVHEVTFDAQGLNSGLYIYRIQSGEFDAAKKMLLIR